MAGLAAGTVVGGKYRLDAPIGRGGMASVWRATHTTLESSVAVKFLETFGTSRDNMAKRFLREAKLAGGLRHRNVVHILDYGVMDDGQPFMVMELLEGMSLADRLDNRFDDRGPKLEVLELLDIVSKVLSGLAVVHDSGIVHRDIKPDNIFLVSDADGEYPKLLDFGISRGLGTDLNDTRVTSTGAVIGTPLYMSPEQARGMSDVDQRTDLWSVGMILWEGLTGILPFDSEHMGDVLIRIATEDAPSIGDHRDDLPGELVDLITKVLKRDRDARFTSARQMREAVLAAADLIAAGTGTPRRRDPSMARVPKPIAAVTGEIAPMPKRSTRWPLFFGIGAVALTAVVVSFIALGGEIRFSSASAEPDPTAAPPSEPEAIDPVAATIAEPPVAEAAVAQAPVAEAPVAEAPVAEPVEAVEAPVEAAAPVVVREGATPARPRTRRTPRRRGTEAPPAEPRETSPQTPTKAPRQEGGFLRDLDY